MSKPERDSLGNRMKGYEDAFRFYLPKRMPLIIRVDGKAFHTLTRGLNKPFDERFMNTMLGTAVGLCNEIQGVKLAYWQSDEISLLVTDYDTLTTQAPFDKNLQKLVSISAGIATERFNYFLDINFDVDDRIKYGVFDSRAFILPKEEVCNYFLWRMQDAVRNSINSVGQSQFSPKQLHCKNTDQVQDMLFKEKGINWNDIPTLQKRGACVVKIDNVWTVDREIPIFSQNRNYINRFVYVGED